MQLCDLKWEHDGEYGAWTWHVGGTNINIIRYENDRYSLYDNDAKPALVIWRNIDAIELQCLLHELIPDTGAVHIEVPGRETTFDNLMIWENFTSEVSP